MIGGLGSTRFPSKHSWKFTTEVTKWILLGIHSWPPIIWIRSGECFKMLQPGYGWPLSWSDSAGKPQIPSIMASKQSAAWLWFFCALCLLGKTMEACGSSCPEKKQVQPDQLIPRVKRHTSGSLELRSWSLAGTAWRNGWDLNWIMAVLKADMTTPILTTTGVYYVYR